METYTLFSHYKKFPKADLFSTYFKFMFPNLTIKFIDIAYKNKIKCVVKSNNENNFNIFKEHFDKLDLLNESEESNKSHVFESNFLKYVVTGYNPLELGLRILNISNKPHCLDHPAEFYYDGFKNPVMHYFNNGEFIGTLELKISESSYDHIDNKGNKYHNFANNDDYINFMKLNIFK